MRSVTAVRFCLADCTIGDFEEIHPVPDRCWFALARCFSLMLTYFIDLLLHLPQWSRSYRQLQLI